MSFRSIYFSKEAPYGAGMAIFACLAYPDKLDDDVRMGDVHASLYHLYLRHKANQNPDWFFPIANMIIRLMR